ncbi:PepSY-associated TM helix domain-containing protein [Pseudemcibacter aquimaris]|uniref:PepSY-associated TM helix domain-containing protein n=1 Tax=Pseudemcibacter aquimaris TaxID=2857064 RepID=UPI0020136C6E|nr:PepSY-associated TM helix domain-containing protein [Pseudemcibacter aquimaris]MCC3862124.1 PepSY domain-containing protein [Pseudemcibacter aquimaris]WDU58877.1 PepSY domain-containing protein [Pseudemcibacter aquimaris]
MNLNKLNRTIHNWVSIFIALPLLLIIVSGLFLQLKKDFEWIQPSSVRGESDALPVVSHEALLAAATSIPQTAGMKWSEFDRIDYKVDRGMVKFMTVDGWEVQVDTTNAKVLSVAERRSDFFEKLHDGSYFGDFAKYYIILPTGIILFVLWITGLWMFIYPYIKKAANKKRKARLAAEKKQ